MGDNGAFGLVCFYVSAVFLFVLLLLERVALTYLVQGLISSCLYVCIYFG